MDEDKDNCDAEFGIYAWFVDHVVELLCRDIGLGEHLFDFPDDVGV